jgi:excisionase family DNA binding protein
MTKLAMKPSVSSEGSFFEKKIGCEWLSTQEAARYLSISENALRIMVHRGQIISHKFGRRLRFNLYDLQRLFSRKGV